MSQEVSIDIKQRRDTVQDRLARKITSELDENIFKMNDFSKTTSVEEYFRNIDERVNCKIAAGMKKAVHLLVDKFDILLQNRLKLILAKHVKDEVDQRVRTLRQVSQAKVFCAKCKSAQRKDLAKPKNCSNCTDLKKKSPTVKQIRTKVQERVDRSIEHHQQRLQSPRARGPNCTKYPYKSPNRFFESQESSIRSVEDLQYSIETSPANILTRSPHRHNLQSPIADASFCSSDKACPYGKGPPHLEHPYPPGQGIIREKCPKKLVNARVQSKESKNKKPKQEAPKPQKLGNLSCLHNKSRNSFAAAPKSARQNDLNATKRPRDLKMKRAASKASVGDSQVRTSNVKKSNDALKQRQDEFVDKLPIGYPMELKEDLIDSRLKWLNNTQQVSALFDEVDEIYKEQDPIEESLELRKKHNGFINNYSVVRTKKRETRKFFFYLKSKLPAQNSIFEVSPVQLMSQLRKQERAEAIRVIDESDHRRNPNIMLPQSSNSSSRVKISGSQSTQKIDRSGQNSASSQQNISINNEYKPPVSSSQAMQTYTDSRKYSDSERADKLPSGQPVKRRPDQLFKQAFQQEKKYQAKSIPGSPDQVPKDSIKVIERPSPDKWVVLDQSSQDALKDIKLAHSFEKSADQQISLDQNLLSPMKSQLNSPDQKRAIHTISDNSGLVAPMSPLDDPLHPVYSPEKHPQMLHALIQQQSPEKIHFETFEKKPEDHEVKLQVCRVRPESNVFSPAKRSIGPGLVRGSAERGLDGGHIDEAAKQTPQRSSQRSPRKGWNKVPKKEELISESLPESPQKLPQQNELKELERETPFNYHSQDFSLDISHDRELVESHTPLNSQMRSQMTQNAPPSASPLKPSRVDPPAGMIYRLEAKEMEYQQIQESIGEAEDIQESPSPANRSPLRMSPEPQQSPERQPRSIRGNQITKEMSSPRVQRSPRDLKSPEERKSPQEKIEIIKEIHQKETMEELGQTQGGTTVQQSTESVQILRQKPEQHEIGPISEEKSQEENSSTSVRINVSSLDIDDQSKYIKELDKLDKKPTRKGSSSGQPLSTMLEKDSERQKESGASEPSAQQQIQCVQQASESVLNTVQALERALNQVKVKHTQPTPTSEEQLDLQQVQAQEQAHIPEQIQVLNDNQTIHKQPSPPRRLPSPAVEDVVAMRPEDEDAQLKQIMDQFEVLDERQARPRQLSQTQVAPGFINENEIDEAINEVLESSSLHFNKELKNQKTIEEGSSQSASDISLSTNHKAMQLDNFQERFVTQIIQPFQDDHIEDIKITKGLNEAQSSGVESMFQEMAKGKLLVETSPRKAHGQHHIDFEQPSRDSPPDNPKTSPRQYQADNMGIVEKLTKVAKPHTRQVSALVGGLAPTSDSATPFRRGMDVTQKTQTNAFAEILQLLHKNSFIRDLGQENMTKLAAEIQKAVFKKNDQIVRFGDISQHYYILHKGKIKVTEYEPSTSPHDLDLENKITLVKYINKEGHGFGEESVKNFTPLKASIDAIENCEFYVLDGFLINEILTKVSQDRMSSLKESQKQKHVLRRLSERDPVSDDQQRTDSNIHLRHDILQPNMNFMPESFLTESQSSRHRIRAASYCPVKVGQEQNDLDDLLNCDLSAIRQKDQPSISGSSSSASQSLKDLTYASFIENGDNFGLCLRELALFGDRAPATHSKMRVLTKGLSQLHWITANEQGYVCIAVQTPRSSVNFSTRARMLQAERDFYSSTKPRKDIQRYLFALDGVLSQDGSPDVWQVYRTDQRKDAFRSLYDALFDVTFDQRLAASKMYEIEHSAFYRLVSQRKGHRHLARLIQKICDFLLHLQDSGIVYGNLRAENIMIRMDEEQKEIQQVKFIDFGSTAKMERAAEMLVPEKIEHCPPDLLKHLIDIEKFQKGHRQTPEQQRLSKRKINEISESLDVYSLGVLLLQITAGCPLQLPLPLRFRYKTVKGQQFINSTLYGTSPAQPTHSNMEVKHLIAMQENFSSNMSFFLQKNDLYKLTQDQDFLRLLQRMLQKDHSKRPTARAILSDRFVKKWTKH